MIESFWKGASYSLAPRNKSNGLIWFRGRLFSLALHQTFLHDIPNILQRILLPLCVCIFIYYFFFFTQPKERPRRDELRSTYSFH